ncbi:MAG: SWIM zinc finger family protein [Anaerolineae bacterium]|nr:SWIM zinc finger family protein [Anaerolineae bacterium]MDW8171435.1 SWIM zinc finger family protein [Anaerolineae bacterium]
MANAPKTPSKRPKPVSGHRNKARPYRIPRVQPARRSARDSLQAGIESHHDETYSPPRRADGLKSRTEHGAFAENWWAKRWINVLESYGLGTRLQRGQEYARKGQVLSLTIEVGRVRAKVQGSRPKPYQVLIEVKPLTDEEWERALDAISEQAIFTAQLLDGTMPQEIESAFEQANVGLFPDHVRDIMTECNCPDTANPCKHIAAVYYLLGEHFDQDPFLIFAMRGKTRQQVIEALRQRRAAATLAEASTQEAPLVPGGSVPIRQLLDSFWGQELNWSPAPIQPPVRPMPLMRHLGPAPGDTQEYFENLYQAITAVCLKMIRNGEDD